MDQQPSNNMPNVTPVTPVPESHQKVAMGVLSYLGILVLIPIILAKDDPFVKFHIKQGLLLLLIDIAVWVIISAFFWQWFVLGQVINLGILVMVVLGIINVVNGKQQELPIIGAWAKNIPL